MKKSLYSLASLLLGGVMMAQPCSTFENPNPQGNWMNIVCGISFANTNPLDGSQCATLRDWPGGSIFQNTTDFNSMGRNYLNQCLCFDYNVTDDGHPGSSTPIKPTIYLSMGSKYIYFEAATTIYEGNTWVRVCAPIKLSSGGVLPGNADGQWKQPAGQTAADFDAVLQGCTSVHFFIDVAGSSYQTEDVRIDNVCIKDCRQEPLPCVRFESDADMGNWTAVLSSLSLGTNPLDGSNCATLGDNSGASYFQNNSDYNDLAQRFLNKCICFDYNVSDDGHFGTSVPINPTIYFTDGTNTVWFRANTTIYEGSTWIHVCAPIELSSGGILPSNADGQWGQPATQTATDFDNVLLNVTQVFFIVDVAGSSYQTEEISVDNVCIEDCKKPFECDPSFRLETSTNTSPSQYPSPPSYMANIFLNYNNPNSTYTVDWGDGNVTGPFVSHLYAGPGSYIICVTEYQNDVAVCRTCMSFCFGDSYSVGLPIKANPVEGRKANIPPPVPPMLKDFNEADYSIFPNPASSSADIKLSLAKKETVSVRVLDMMGKVVSDMTTRTLEAGSQTLNVDTDRLPTGVYSVELTVGGQVSSLKLSVVK